YPLIARLCQASLRVALIEPMPSHIGLARQQSVNEAVAEMPATAILDAPSIEMVGYGFDPERTGAASFQVKPKEETHDFSFGWFNVKPSLDLVPATLNLDRPVPVGGLRSVPKPLARVLFHRA